MKYPKTYLNWSENLSNTSLIEYPRDNSEISAIIRKARVHKKIIRVVGSSHSASPMVSEKDESLVLVSLAQYQLEPDNCVVDPDEMTVQVNAGWTLGQLYDELNSKYFFLETQPASGAFTIGGLIGTPVHGGRLGASLISDSVLEIQFLNEDGQVVIKNHQKHDLGLYQLGLGIFGIIIRVTFRIHQMLDVETHLSTFSNVFLEKRGVYHLDRKMLKNFFWERISYCLQEEESENSDGLDSEDLRKSQDQEKVLRKKARYTHCFLDFHNNVLLALDWIERRKARKIRLDTPESKSIPKVSNVFQKRFFSKYRTHDKYLKTLGKVIRASIEQSVYLNKFDDQDMLWVGLGTRVYFMSYFIPIYTDGEVFNWSKVARPLEIIMRTIQRFREQGKTFILDFPTDFRFVTSSQNSLNSPIFDPNQRIVYLALDLTAGPGNIYLGDEEKSGCWTSSKFRKQLNQDFREFYALIETKWRKFGGVSHWGKLFGFQLDDPSHTGPFHPDLVQGVFSEETKSRLRKMGRDVFMNNFTRELIQWEKSSSENLETSETDATLFEDVISSET